MPTSEAAPRGPWLRLAVFAAPPLLLWALLEWGMARVPDSHDVKREQLRALASQVDTLILGASESYYGIAPQALSGTAYNLANTSQSLYCDDQLVQRVLPQLPRLRRAILPVSYFTLWFQLYDHPESWRQYQFRQGWGIPPQRLRDRLDLRMWSRVALFSPRTALEQLRAGFRGTLAPQVDDRGWYRVPEQERYELTPTGAREVLSRHHSYMHPAYLAANEAALEHLVATLRGRGVDVVLLTMPVWSTYRAEMQPWYQERTRAVLERLARQYGATVLSFADEPRLTAEDFMDADHLNQRGALRFSALLDEALRAPSAYSPPRPP
jgi:hypothetical protein